ncbi:unnamed protein product [Ectocarpus sp. 13 AM-2016]
MPHELALLLREELDVSRRLGCDEAGHWEREGRGGAVDRLYQRDTETPVVAWIAPPPLLDPQNQPSQIQQHRLPRRSQQWQQRTRRRFARRRQGTTAGTSRGMTKATGGLPGDVSLAFVPRGRQQQQQQQQQQQEDSKNNRHSPRGSPRRATVGTSGGRGGERVRASRRRGQHSGGDRDCYKEPRAWKAAVIHRVGDSNGARRERGKSRSIE